MTINSYANKLSGIRAEPVCAANSSRRFGYTNGMAWTIWCPRGDTNEISASTQSAPPATRKLLIGPATEVRMSSRTGFLKFCGFTGVGLAQPSIGIRATDAIKGSKTVPTGSICLIGLSVIRPSMRAVGSPQRFAVQACADS